ncbi:MAG: response regulator [Syntrophobacteraceae bacterium]
MEDDPMLAELLEEYLERLGHERVRTCLTEREALAAINEEDFDCAFVDMRFLDACNFLAGLKEGDHKFPLVLMGGKENRKDAIKGMRMGAFDFLEIPFSPQDMENVLQRIAEEMQLLEENFSLWLSFKDLLGGPMKILVVEDDTISGEILKEFLHRGGHGRVRLCRSAGEAMTAIGEEDFDCAFVDLCLPDRDGFQVLTEIKEQHAGTQVVVMSCFPATDCMWRAMSLGACDYLPKPFNLEDVGIVSMRIRRKRCLSERKIRFQLELQENVDRKSDDWPMGMNESNIGESSAVESPQNGDLHNKTPIPHDQGESMKVLIVEDDPMLAEFLEQLLKRLGHKHVCACATGREAMAAIAEEAFDCAFVDVRLPDIDGLQLLTALKDQDHGLPVVMMSYASMDNTIMAIRKGATDFLGKPFTLKNIALSLERITKERKLLDENINLRFEMQARKEHEYVNRKLENMVGQQIKLLQISREIDEINSLEDLYPRIVRLATSVESVEKAGFYLVNRDMGSLVCTAGSGWGPEKHGLPHINMHEERLRELFANTTTHILIGPEEIAHFFENAPQTDQDLSCWPMRTRGEPFGLLVVSHTNHLRPLPSDEKSLLDFLIKKASLVAGNIALCNFHFKTFHGILRSLVNAFETKGPYTGKHSEKVTHYAVRTAERLGCSSAQIEWIRTAGYLHDIGKTGIPNGILNKPGPLTLEEYEEVKEHPVTGDSMVTDLGLSPEERSIIRHHHERWDGAGYPDRLSGNSIPFLARIVSVADAFDAMTSKRAYRQAKSIEESFTELLKNRGRQFDPDVVDAFIDVVKGSCDISINTKDADIPDSFEPADSIAGNGTTPMKRSDEFYINEMLEKDYLSFWGEFAMNFTHDSSGPLGNIRMIENVLTSGLDTQEILFKRHAGYSLDWSTLLGKQRKRLAALRQQSEKLSSDLRAINHLYSFGRKAESVEVDLNDLLETMAKAFGGLYRQVLRGVHLELRLDHDLPKIKARGRDMVQSLLHLFMNAIIAVRESSERRIEIETGRLDDEMYIRITDTGCGLPGGVDPDILFDLFESRWPGPDSNRDYKGPRPGFGLFAARRLLSPYGCDLKLETKGKKTSATIRIPSTKMDSQAEHP